MSSTDVLCDADERALRDDLDDFNAAAAAAGVETAKEEAPQHNLPRAMQMLREPWLDLEPAPLRLSGIRIGGLKDMRPWFLAGLVQPYADPNAAAAPFAEWRFGERLDTPRPGTETTLPRILQTATLLGSDLARLDLVKDIGVRLEPAENAGSSPEQAVDIVLQVKPTSRYFLKSSTSFGNSEGTASIQGKIRNIFGGAETLDGSATLGTRTRRAYNLVFSTPVLSSPDIWASLSGIAQHIDRTSHIGAQEGLHTLRAAITYSQGGASRHELAYELGHRRLHHISPTASAAVRRLGEPSLKSALSYVFERDDRDDPLFATVGSHVRTELTYAGLGGDTSFLRAEGQVAVSRAFGDGWAWSLSARSGALQMLDGHKSRFYDRFMLGGPTCVRMFHFNALGPHSGSDSLGGDTYWSAGASVVAPLPGKPDWPLKLHAFLNAGQLANALAPTDLLQPSVSAGGGLLFQQGTLRLELNFGVPLAARKSDGLRKGFQFGVGISYL
ncbi:hypothetical protein MCUN1_001559 [Malassezia cuniculi]|uniref:Bacterial surface antigen (D15) domain-containing protein n=1 Tax=Malassezia cuniculi TaxID=948313 RepID=A0AAF0ET14_9BASI|nr:hypothetical protein MCUN1_001559 [Malassezia cuniculi]